MTDLTPEQMSRKADKPLTPDGEQPDTLAWLRAELAEARRRADARELLRWMPVLRNAPVALHRASRDRRAR